MEIVRRFTPSDKRWVSGDVNSCEQLSLLGSLQFTQQLLALIGLDFENQGWSLPERDPFVQASGLTPTLAFQIMAVCRDDFQRILQSVDLS